MALLETRQAFSAFLAAAVNDPKSLLSHALKTFFVIKGWSDNAAAFPKFDLPWPEDGHIQDVVYNHKENRWAKWDSMLPNAAIPEGTAYSDIIVPTQSTAQFDYMLELLLTRRYQTLVCGPTGTGKSAYMRRLLLKSLPRDKFVPIFVAFSAQTSARQTQVRTGVDFTVCMALVSIVLVCISTDCVHRTSST